jgi:hypothetical protein
VTAGGDATLAMARTQLGVTESPPHSNEVPYWAWWGCYLGSWCGAFASWCPAHAGYPLPAIDASCSDSATGFVLCSNGTIHAWQVAGIPAVAEPGDNLIFSWYPWELQGGVPIISSGEWAGWVAGDHTGIFVADLGGGYIQTVEGNTGSTGGGSVLERTDRYWGQVCAIWRPPSFVGGGSGAVTPPPTPTPTPPPSGGAAPPWPGTYLADYTAGGGTAQWQAQMAARGWSLDVDDEYGPASANVCRQFQAEKGLEVDGVVGPITWDAAWTAPVT